MARLALSNERVKCDEGTGRVTVELKTPWCDGTMLLVMTPLVPRPRLHLIHYNGLLVPNAKLRLLVMPAGQTVQDDEPATCRACCGTPIKPSSMYCTGPVGEGSISTRPPKPTTAAGDFPLLNKTIYGCSTNLFADVVGGGVRSIRDEVDLLGGWLDDHKTP